MQALRSGGSRPRWLIPVAVVVGIVLLLVVTLMGQYNSLVDKESDVEQSFADLDTQLQRRFDLIDNLVEGVKAALTQEQEIFGELARARANYAGADRGSDERVEGANQVESAFARLLVIMENYPELRSNETIRDFQVQLEGTENRVAQARREYNGVTTSYNKQVRRFPGSIFAGLFGFDRKPLFEAEAGSRDAPDVDFDLDDDSSSTTTQ